MSLCEYGQVLYAFIDESERDDSFYFLGALVLDQLQLQNLTFTLDSIMETVAADFNFVASTQELHGSEIMRAAESPWRHLPFKYREMIFKKVLLAIGDSGARGYIEGIDIQKHLQKDYNIHYSPRELAFSYLLERINGTSTTADPKIKIFADNHHTAPQSRTNFELYQDYGTFGYRSSKLASIMPKFDFIDSASSRALQAIDMATYIFNRLSTVQEKQPRTQKSKEEIWRLAEPAFTFRRGRTRVWP